MDTQPNRSSMRGGKEWAKVAMLGHWPYSRQLNQLLSQQEKKETEYIEKIVEHSTQTLIRQKR